MNFQKDLNNTLEVKRDQAKRDWPKGTGQKGPAKRDQDPKGTMAKRDQAQKGPWPKGTKPKRDQVPKGTNTQKGP